MTADGTVAAALERDRIIDITTIGHRSGKPRRIEIWFFNVDGRLYITGLPGRRGWYANLLADPQLTFHLKQSAQADLTGTARPITGEPERRAVLERIVPTTGRRRDLDAWVAGSPLVEVELEAA